MQEIESFHCTFILPSDLVIVIMNETNEDIQVIIHFELNLTISVPEVLNSLIKYEFL